MTSPDLDVPVLALPAQTGIEHYRDPATGELRHDPTDHVSVTA
ncbi:hypothetical protein ACWDTD_01470 [Gordonia sp. NPDC003425]